MDEITERVVEFLKSTKLSQVDLEKATGIKQSNISAILRGKRSAGEDIVNKLYFSPLKIDRQYLLTGVKGGTEYPLGIKRITLHDVDAAAGYESFDVMISKENVVGEFVVPTFASADWMIYVRGSSMYPKYSSGDIIACKVIKESQFIQWNKVYVIATREQGLLVKRLMPSDNDGFVKAVSDNEKYPPFDIPKDEIFGLALVLGAIKLE